VHAKVTYLAQHETPFLLSFLNRLLNHLNWTVSEFDQVRDTFF
jgi:hypothetical protein